jgi:hypothetical protein
MDAAQDVRRGPRRQPHLQVPEVLGELLHDGVVEVDQRIQEGVGEVICSMLRDRADSIPDALADESKDPK